MPDTIKANIACCSHTNVLPLCIISAAGDAISFLKNSTHYNSPTYIAITQPDA